MLWARVKGQAAQGREDEAFDEEIREHIALLEGRYTAQGMSARDAARAARRQFGNVTALKERQRAQRGILSPAEWWRDVRFGMRMLAKRPASNAAVVLALALGIGMNAAIFMFVNALLLRPPQGVSRTNKLVEVWLHNPKSGGVQSYRPFNYPDYAYYRDHTKSLDGLMAFDGDGTQAIWNHEGAGEILQGQLVSGNLFPLLGIKPVMGRTLAADDDRLDSPRQVAVLSYPFWKEKLGGDPGVVGKALMLDGAAFTVVGVAPAGFTGLMVGADPDFWAPMAVEQQFMHDVKDRLTNRDSYWLIVAGKMRSAGDRKSVQAEMHVLAKQVYLAHGSKDDFLDAMVYRLTMVPGPFRGYVGAFTGGLLAVFALVLLIACTNAAGLLLARAMGRAREMATRAALGAGRARLVRQMLVESLVLAAVAGAAGVTIAWATSRLLMDLKPANVPITLAIPLDWRVVLFTAAVSVATGVVFGLVPALRASAVEAAQVLREEAQTGGVKKSRMRSALVVAQMATCVVLLAGAALCVRSLMNANAIDAGFDTHHIALATLDPGSLGYTPEKINDFYTRLRERVHRLPGVTSASYAQFLPLGTSRSVTSVGKQLGKDSSAMTVDVYRVDPGFFQTMGIPLLRGRDLTRKEVDSDKPDAVVINETLARRLWPGEDPIGKRFAMGDEKEMSEVVGVVNNGKYHTLGEGPVAVVFRGTLPPTRTLVVRTAGDSRGLLEEVQREVPIVDPLMAATQVQTIEDYMALPLFPARTTGWLLGVSGILAVVMTAIGLFGVIAYMVSQRTHEIGVRMALGARPSDVLKMVMSQGLRLTAIGLGIGLCAAFGAARLLSPLLYGIGANDPATMMAVALGLTAIALTACYLPARKAMSVDPVVALRYE
ncbi:MAG TPA: ABC transporter permease [Acidobacteriaceae bacterium]|jgi:predicted permease|nr:ABC transporter permease [Acidobacteriaceae bacterium]